MNEELKIIIKAVTSDAKKNVKQVKDEINKLGSEGGKAGKSSSSAMASLGKAAGVAVGAVAAVATTLLAVGSALVNLSKNTKQYREEQAKLLTAFQAAGAGAAEATQAYNGLYRFLGDSGKATEAAGHLAKLTTNEQHLAEWTTTLQGVYATFGDSLPIEGLTEAANETAKVGQVTGVLADALNWAGVNEDAFNASLAACNTEAEREALIRETLNGLYYDAAAIYEKNNAEIIAANEAQARLDAITGQLGRTTTPLVTALTNLSATLLQALAPAIQFITNVMVVFINKISQAVQWVANLIGALTGTKAASTTAATVATNMGSAATGAQNLANNTNAATKAAEKLKRATASFDELNKVSSQSSSAGSGGSGGAGGAGAGGVGSVGTGGIIDTNGLTGALDSSSSKIDAFLTTVKNKIAELKDVFAPTIDAWGAAFDTIGAAWDSSKGNFLDGVINIKDGFLSVATYVVTDFVPSIINSFSENIVPVFADVFSFGITEASLAFESISGIVKDFAENQIVPHLDTIKTMFTDVFSSVKSAWDKHGGALMEQVSIFLGTMRGHIEDLYYEVISPILTKIRDKWNEVWTNSLKPMVDEIIDAALDIGTNIMLLYNKYVTPVVEWFKDKIYPIIVKIVNAIVDKVGDAISSIGTIIKNCVQILKGIIQFITGVFTGDWKKAWNGIKNIFKGVFDNLYTIIKVPLNAIISGINAVLKGITSAVNVAIRALNKLSITIPDWVPEYGGKTFGFNLKEMTAPQIPALAEGGIAIGETLARIGEGGRKEAVLPLEQNTEWLDMLADRLAARSAAPSKIILNVDGKELGWASINGINNITRQTGTLQLALV